MSEYILSPLAQADIDGIWEYTKENWGGEQAVRYLQDIRDACRDLASGARTGRSVDIRAEYRKYTVGSHVVYFKIVNGSTVIVRIPHQRMDVNRHL